MKAGLKPAVRKTDPLKHQNTLFCFLLSSLILSFHSLLSSMNYYEETRSRMMSRPQTWVITGVAGFIGSNLLLELLRTGQRVVGVDNLITGHLHNLDEVRDSVTSQQWENFTWVEGDVTDIATCRRVCAGAHVVLHQAALGSVPRSIEHPNVTNHHNVGGFLNMLLAAKDAGVGRFVYASSSAVYGDHPGLPKVEGEVGECLSPYAVSKKVNELYAGVFAKCYGIECVGLRYFNVFGPRQDPNGPYAAVIPKWVDAMLQGGEVVINGDGETSRDFCYIANVVQANLLAATAEGSDAVNTVYNIAAGGRTTLNALYGMLRQRLQESCEKPIDESPSYRDFRAGDVRHSNADISKAGKALGYSPVFDIESGLDQCIQWYVARERELRVES
jgi:UDP-N-acetylglucosamine 4-epimerase